jgi:hypothetical protein
VKCELPGAFGYHHVTLDINWLHFITIHFTPNFHIEPVLFSYRTMADVTVCGGRIALTFNSVGEASFSRLNRSFCGLT